LYWHSAVGAVVVIFRHILCKALVVEQMELAALELHDFHIQTLFLLVFIAFEADRALRTFFETSKLFDAKLFDRFHGFLKCILFLSFLALLIFKHYLAISSSCHHPDNYYSKQKNCNCYPRKEDEDVNHQPQEVDVAIFNTVGGGSVRFEFQKFASSFDWRNQEVNKAVAAVQERKDLKNCSPLEHAYLNLRPQQDVDELHHCYEGQVVAHEFLFGDGKLSCKVLVCYPHIQKNHQEHHKDSPHRLCDEPSDDELSEAPEVLEECALCLL
jgi:hypothetical protein